LAGAAWAANESVWKEAINSAVSARTVGTSGLRTGLAVPIRVSGQTQAVICLFSDRVVAKPKDLGVRTAALTAHIGQYLHRRRAEEAELALARTKDEYLALIGHEMRTPLTSIVSYTELALDQPDQDPTTHRLLGVVERNADRLRRIIDELLDLAALDAHEGVHLDETVDLAVLVTAATDAIRDQTRAVGLKLRTDLAPGCVVLGDGDRLRQVIDHLLQNAVHHTPPGGRLTVTLAQDGDTVALTVADTGVGIRPDERDHVFARFYRTAYSREHQIPGAGLGLAISRAIIEIHGGTLNLVADRPPPTELVIRLPAASQDHSVAGGV
jgi:signal transduction histidine kinase